MTVQEGCYTTPEDVMISNLVQAYDFVCCDINVEENKAAPKKSYDEALKEQMR